MKLTVEQFVTVVRALPLSASQVAAAEAAIAANAPNELPKELIRREVLTEYQARLILAGRGAELVVGRYVLLSELGAGGMGTVFMARDTAMDRVVALKLIRDERLANPAALGRFQQEVRAAARLAHPNIVRAYDAGTADGRQFLVTELVTGFDLGHELARRGALPAGEACEYARQAAVGLQHAHEQGLTHRDIKPSNLLFSTAERLVKIADFGLARVGDPGPNGLTADGSVMGTPDYISPEQAISATSADIRSDLYSLGCTLYHFLTGRVPFLADSAYAKLLAHAREEPEPLDDACPGLNPALVAVVQKLMAKNRADRYQTPLEAAEALIPFCPKPRTGTTSVVSRPATAPSVPVAAAVAVVAQPVSASAPVILATPSTQNNAGRKTLPPPLPLIPDAFPVPDPQPAPKSNKLLALAGIAGGVLALVVLIVVLVHGGNTNTNTNQNNVNVTVPVSVNLDDWAKAREPGVVLVLGDRTLALADFAKLELKPGHHIVIARKDGKDLEARAFDVKEGDAGKAVASRLAAVPDPAGVPGAIRTWHTETAVTDLVWHPAGNRFIAQIGRMQLHDANDSKMVSASGDGFCDKVAQIALEGKPLALSVWGHGSQWPGSKALPYDGSPVVSCGESGPPAGGWRLNADLPYSAWQGSPDGQRILCAARGPNELKAKSISILGLNVTPNSMNGFKELYSFPGSTGCFDPSGTLVVTAQAKTVTVYDTNTGNPRSPSYTGSASELSGVTMSTDGKQIAGIGGDP